jgi:phosphatidylglycerophosphate synthase
MTRRPIKARETRWAAAAARGLARAGFRPNQISLASIAFAAGAALCFLLAGRADAGTRGLWLIGAALCIQLRLLCNLFDGMVAVEGGFRTKSGEIYNELPDRFADLLILAGAGYSSPDPAYSAVCGWSAAALSIVTAYVRALGAACGASQYFIGPMAKQQRMAVTTAAALANAAFAFLAQPLDLMPVALALAGLGCAITIFRRTARIVKELEAK